MSHDRCAHRPPGSSRERPISSPPPAPRSRFAAHFTPHPPPQAFRSMGKGLAHPQRGRSRDSPLDRGAFPYYGGEHMPATSTACVSDWVKGSLSRSRKRWPIRSDSLGSSGQSHRNVRGLALAPITPAFTFVCGWMSVACRGSVLAARRTEPGS